MDLLKRSATLATGRKRILVVEDEEDTSRLIRHNLHAAGYAVELALSAASVLPQALGNRRSLILLDVMLPGTNSFELCRQIRECKPLSGIPIIFLTGKIDDPDRVKGLELGADDFINKPFSPRELVARVRAVLRATCDAVPPEVLRLGGVEIDASSMTVRVDGQEVLTTVREFRLLEYLAAHPGRVFTRDQLLAAVWKAASVTPRSVDVYVQRLREKIETDTRHPRYLKTLRGIGYRMDGPK